MNEIERAIARGMDELRLGDASHEVAHGFGFLAAGVRPKHMKLETGFFGGRNGGHCYLGDHDVSKRHAKAYLVGIVCGHAGEARFGHVYLGMGRSEAYRWAASDARGDYAMFAEQSEWVADAFRIRVSADWAYERAEGFVYQHGARLDRLTVRLAKSGRLSGGAL